MDYQEVEEIEEGEARIAAPEKPMGNLRWFILLAIAIVVDILQFLIELLDLTIVGAAVSVIVNRLIDIMFAILLLFYLRWRKVNMDWKAWGSIAGAFIAEAIPLVSALPLWSLDIAYVWAINNEGIIAGVTGAVVGERAVSKGMPPGSLQTPPPIQTASTSAKTADAQNYPQKQKTKDLTGTISSKNYPAQVESKKTGREIGQVYKQNREIENAKLARNERIREKNQAKSPQYGTEIRSTQESEENIK